MNIRDVQSIEDLKIIIANNDFESFNNLCVSERKSKTTYVNNSKLYLNSIYNHELNLIRKLIKKLIYKNWYLFRFFMKPIHVIRNLDNPREFYLNHRSHVKTTYFLNRVFLPVNFDERESSKNAIIHYYQSINQIVLSMKLLSDEYSKSLLIALIKTRLTFDLSFIEKFREPYKNQYMDKLIDFNEQDKAFVDAGAYDGDTAQYFFNTYPNFKKGYLFEPNSLNRSKLEARLKSYNYDLYPYGLSSENSEVTITLNESASTINYGKNSESLKKERINLVKLDDFINNKVSFIKMDIEGSELAALKGSEQIIQKFNPVLAICIYHRLSDIWEIPAFISSITVDYSYYIRHYSSSPENIYETVMYAVPKKKKQ